MRRAKPARYMLYFLRRHATKEGAGALFSMAAVNDRITRFVRDHDLPVIIFGYGDCTGGAKRDFVTHPLVQTYYLSGTSMPFAGQIVVSSNLPLVYFGQLFVFYTGFDARIGQAPFYEDLDQQLRKVDAGIPAPQETVEDVVERVLSGGSAVQRPIVVAQRETYAPEDLIRPVNKVLIHARGCTAAKLIRIAQQQNIDVVLVQSDPDMESLAADQLRDRDTLVCIGGNTPDESYLNAKSVLNVAQMQGVTVCIRVLDFCPRMLTSPIWCVTGALILSDRPCKVWRPWATSPMPLTLRLD